MRSNLTPLLAFALANIALGVEIHGHRGARAAMPENTIPAFEYAIAHGVDVLELDLAVTKDGVAVVSHDPVLPKALCRHTAGGEEPTRVIREMTLDQLREWDCGSLQNPEFPAQKTIRGARVPTLDEVLALADRGSFRFNIETKIPPQRPELAPAPEEFAGIVAGAVRKHRLEARVIIQSFDFRVLEVLERIAPAMPRAALWSQGATDFVSVCTKARATIASPHYTLVTPERVAAAHAAGLKVVTWTANTPDVWQRLLDAKVDGIITDDPAALLAWMKGR